MRADLLNETCKTHKIRELECQPSSVSGEQGSSMCVALRTPAVFWMVPELSMHSMCKQRLRQIAEPCIFHPPSRKRNASLVHPRTIHNVCLESNCTRWDKETFLDYSVCSLRCFKIMFATSFRKPKSRTSKPQTMASSIGSEPPSFLIEMNPFKRK